MAKDHAAALARLKALIEQVAPAFVAHLEGAKALQATLFDPLRPPSTPFDPLRPPSTPFDPLRPSSTPFDPLRPSSLRPSSLPASFPGCEISL
jgi:hypothetical protein